MLTPTYMVYYRLLTVGIEVAVIVVVLPQWDQMGTSPYFTSAGIYNLTSTSTVGQFIYFKRLVGTIKNDLTNYRQYVDSSQISDVESDDILLLKLKGIAIECIYQQDQLDGSPIEEIILLLLLYNKGFLNKLTYEQFNNRFLPQVRYLAATELLYVMYIGSVARNRMSKKLERLLSVMLLPIINWYLVHN